LTCYHSVDECDHAIYDVSVINTLTWPCLCCKRQLFSTKRL